MSGSAPRVVHRRPYEIACICVVLCCVELIVEGSFNSRTVVASTVAFLIPCVVISARPRKVVVAVLPLLLVPTGLFTVGTALVAIVLLTVGPYAVHVLIALAEW